MSCDLSVKCSYPYYRSVAVDQCYQNVTSHVLGGHIFDKLRTLKTFFWAFLFPLFSYEGLRITLPIVSISIKPQTVESNNKSVQFYISLLCSSPSFLSSYLFRCWVIRWQQVTWPWFLGPTSCRRRKDQIKTWNLRQWASRTVLPSSRLPCSLYSITNISSRWERETPKERWML